MCVRKLISQEWTLAADDGVRQISQFVQVWSRNLHIATMSSFTGYLQSLTPSQRDAFLEKTMILVDQPIEHKVNIGYLTFVEEDTPIVNYSQFYSLLPPDLKSSSFHHFPDHQFFAMEIK